MRETYSSWPRLVKAAKPYFVHTESSIPTVADEMRGMVAGASVDLYEAWAVSLEDELLKASDHCTTIATNAGRLVGHNEDWSEDAADSLFVLRKRVGDCSILELFYAGTLGGNSVSVNSHGYVHAVNSLEHTDYRVGVPRNAVARWLSETTDPRRDLDKFSRWQRSSGYHHFFCSTRGPSLSLECSATKFELVENPDLPFVHTNHFVTKLKSLEDNDNSEGTFSRYTDASRMVTDDMTTDQMMTLLNDRSNGKNKSLFNRRTIGQAIIELNDENVQMNVWLKRESEKGFVRYAL